MSPLETIRRLFRRPPPLPPRRPRRVTLCRGEGLEIDGVHVGLISTARDSADLLVSSRATPTFLNRQGPAT